MESIKMGPDKVYILVTCYLLYSYFFAFPNIQCYNPYEVNEEFQMFIFALNTCEVIQSK